MVMGAKTIIRYEQRLKNDGINYLGKVLIRFTFFRLLNAVDKYVGNYDMIFYSAALR